MAMFKEAHDFSIRDSTFNIIHGNLITYENESSRKRCREEKEEEEEAILKRRYHDLLHILDDVSKFIYDLITNRDFVRFPL